MISGALIVAWQTVLLLIATAGYGAWLWLISGRPALDRAQTWIWFGLAGFCSHALLLQSFVYLGCPLDISARPALALGVVGLALGFRSWKKSTSRCTGTGEGKLYALVFVAGFLGQAPGLIVLGPERYFGAGHFDQANYVVTAEFLRSEPFDTASVKIGYRPWLVRALETKEQRITECVALGALAATDGTSAQENYGTVSLFFVALAGVATMAWLRSAGLSPSAAGWAGVAVALTPGLTRIQLDGFFSQTTSLFIYPALAGLLGGNETLTKEKKLCAAVLLAFFIGSYTEMAVFGVLLTGLLVLMAEQTWRQRMFDGALILGGALLLNPGYLGRLQDFLIAQAKVAGNPENLAALFPESGTWLGWGRLFLDTPWSLVTVAGGGAVVLLGLWSACSQPPEQRRRWWIILGVALLPLVILRLSPHFSKYAFAKITVQFIPVWIGASMMGLVRLSGASNFERKLVWSIGGLGAVAVGVTAMPLHWAIIHPTGRLTLLSSPELLRVRREVSVHPQSARLVSHPDPLVAQWLCYFGRDSQVVFDRRTLGDRLVPTESYVFRRWAPKVGSLSWLDPERTGPVGNYEPPPTIAVRGALEEGASAVGSYFVVGDTIDFVFKRDASSTGKPRDLWLDFVFVPFPNQGECQLSLVDTAGKVQRMIASSAGWLRWRVVMPANESLYRMNVVPLHGQPVGSGRALVKSLSVETVPDLSSSDPLLFATPARDVP